MDSVDVLSGDGDRDDGEEAEDWADWKRDAQLGGKAAAGMSRPLPG